MTVHIGRYFKDLVKGCCSNKVYAVIFRQDHYAMKEVTESPLLFQMDQYISESHADFCIVLGEHPQRSMYYYRDIGDSEFSLEATTEGQVYYIEFWERTVSGYDYSRDEDTLHFTDPFIWDGSKFVDAVISSIQVNGLSKWTAHLAATYEPSNQELRIVSWLDKNGVIQEDTEQVSVKLYNRSGEKILDETITTQKAPGFFMWDSPGLSLDSDDIFALRVAIKNSLGVEYETGQAIVTWN